MSRAENQTNTDRPPTLYLVCGPNGAGKSTLINRLESNGQVLLAVNAEAIQKSLGPAHWALAESPPSRR